MAHVTQIGIDLSFRDHHRNPLAYAAFEPNLGLYCFNIEPRVQDVTAMCFPPMSAKACHLAADLLAQMMSDTGH